MTSQRPSLAGIVSAIAAVVMAVALALLFVDHGVAGTPYDDIAVVAIDADPSGNGPRSVGTIENCLSAAAGESVVIDIVVPDPGVPADRGMAAYQFSILYDPTVVWIDADDGEMLLAQAAGSNMIPIADPKPDKNGVYQSWGVDFGPSGIEPSGSSETGPGIVARITLLPQSAGISTLTLSNVLVIDDASERISLESVQSATIHVGESCPETGEQATPTSTPIAAPASGQPTPTPNPATPTPEDAALSSAPVSPDVIPSGGGIPPAAGVSSAWLEAFGLALALGGVGLIIGWRATSTTRTRTWAGRPLPGEARKTASGDE